MSQKEDFPIISDDPATQAFYLKCRKEGTSHSLSEMFATQQGPTLNTDATFLEGRGGCYNQFAGQEWIGDRYRKMAEAAGVSTTGKVYQGGLANFPGDPMAWVSGRGDVKRVCEERGMSCSGAVTVKAQEPIEAPAPPVGIADDLVAERVQEKLDANPDLVPSEDLWHTARNEIKPHWAD